MAFGVVSAAPDSGDGAGVAAVVAGVCDGVATDLIAAGIPEDVASAAPQAHALSKWLGADAGVV
ncbi:hypothetical protein [Tsukamurella soli]|uniref:Uncharacterized protein n=1 Tax=Tsukamurella soli TaxID=644556 RepID=A0ABP8KHQ4_9ACTN